MLTTLLKTLLLVSILLSPSFILAQKNLVLNGSFEEYEGSKVPNFIPQLKGWTLLKPTEGGYVHPKRRYFTPTKNAWGYQEAQDGQAYVFAKLGGKPIGEYHSLGDVSSTYLSSQLISPMKAGLDYELSFYVSMADKSNCALNRIGLFISEEAIDTTSYDKNIKFKIPQAMTMDIVDQTEEWVKISSVYTAKGGEKFITIGVFGPNHFVKKKIYKRGSHFKEAFYYIDNVQVIEPADNQDIEITKQIDALFASKSKQAISQIQFKTASSELDSSSFAILDTLADRLLEKEGTLAIIGHTDNTGEASDNLLLSQQRATSVRNYLINKGIAAKRLKTTGMGQKEPIAPNDTPEGRKKNRRVELQVSTQL